MAHVLAKLSGVAIAKVREQLEEDASAHAEQGMVLLHLWQNAENPQEAFSLSGSGPASLPEAHEGHPCAGAPAATRRPAARGDFPGGRLRACVSAIDLIAAGARGITAAGTFRLNFCRIRSATGCAGACRARAPRETQPCGTRSSQPAATAQTRRSGPGCWRGAGPATDGLPPRSPEGRQGNG